MVALVLLFVGIAGFIGLFCYWRCCKPFESLFASRSDSQNSNAPKKQAKKKSFAEMSTSFSQSTYATRVSQTLEKYAPQSTTHYSSMRKKLEQAGIPFSPSVWRVCVVSACFLCAALCSLIVGMLSTSVQVLIIGALCGALFAFVASKIIIQNEIKQRKARLLASFPNAMELLAAMMQAGCPLERGITEIGKTSNTKQVGEIAHEFARVSREMNHAGISLESALNNMTGRCDLPEITAALGAILQARQQGASVGTILTRQARVSRNTYFTNIKTKINRIEVWVIIPLGCCFIPAMVILAMAPTVANLFTQLPGLFS